MKLNLDNLSLVKPVLVVCLVSLLVYLFVFQPSIASIKLVQDKRKSIETTFDEDSGPECKPNVGQLCPGGFPCPQTGKCPGCEKVLTKVCDRDKYLGRDQCTQCVQSKKKKLLEAGCASKSMNAWCNQTPPPSPSSGNCKQKLQTIQSYYKSNIVIVNDDTSGVASRKQFYYDSYVNIIHLMKLEKVPESDIQDFVSCVEDRDFLKNFNITNLYAIFSYVDFKDPSSHNLDISKWDTSSVTNMNQAFLSAKNIPDISGWDTSSVTDMNNMFASAENIPDISGWDTRNVTNMKGMFTSAENIPDISIWDTRNVTNMSGMFASKSFNHDIKNWDVKNVTNMNSMFQNATSFNQDISNWILHPNVTFRLMFDNATSMNPKYTPQICDHVPIT
jgi:surface protein